MKIKKIIFRKQRKKIGTLQAQKRNRSRVSNGLSVLISLHWHPPHNQAKERKEEIKLEREKFRARCFATYLHYATTPVESPERLGFLLGRFLVLQPNLLNLNLAGRLGEFRPPAMGPPPTGSPTYCKCALRQYCGRGCRWGGGSPRVSWRTICTGPSRTDSRFSDYDDVMRS